MSIYRINRKERLSGAISAKEFIKERKGAIVAGLVIVMEPMTSFLAPMSFDIGDDEEGC